MELRFNCSSNYRGIHLWHAAERKLLLGQKVLDDYPIKTETFPKHCCCSLSRFQFKVKPELHYGEEDCPVSIADGFSKDDELQFELIDFSKVKETDANLDVVLLPKNFRKIHNK